MSQPKELSCRNITLLSLAGVVPGAFFGASLAYMVTLSPAFVGSPLVATGTMAGLAGLGTGLITFFVGYIARYAKGAFIR